MLPDGGCPQDAHFGIGFSKLDQHMLSLPSPHRSKFDQDPKTGSRFTAPKNLFIIYKLPSWLLHAQS